MRWLLLVSGVVACAPEAADAPGPAVVAEPAAEPADVVDPRPLAGDDDDGGCGDGPPAGAIGVDASGADDPTAIDWLAQGDEAVVIVDATGIPVLPLAVRLEHVPTRVVLRLDVTRFEDGAALGLDDPLVAPKVLVPVDGDAACAGWASESVRLDAGGLDRAADAQPWAPLDGARALLALAVHGAPTDAAPDGELLLEVGRLVVLRVDVVQ